MTKKWVGIILAAGAAGLWGLMGIFTRGLNAEQFSVCDVAFLRCLLAGLCCLAITLARSPHELKISPKGLAVCLVYGILSYGISFTTYSFSAARIPVAITAVLAFMNPIWVTLFSFVAFKEKITFRRMLIIALCMFGACLVADVANSTGAPLNALGIIAGIANGVGVALQIMIPRFFQNKYSRNTMLVYGFLGSALFLALFADFSKIGGALAGANSLSVIWNIFGIAILCTSIANVAYVKSTAYVNTSTTSILAAIEIVVSSLVGLLVFNESLNALQIAGAVIVVASSLGSELLPEAKKQTCQPFK